MCFHKSQGGQQNTKLMKYVFSFRGFPHVNSRNFGLDVVILSHYMLHNVGMEQNILNRLIYDMHTYTKIYI